MRRKKKGHRRNPKKPRREDKVITIRKHARNRFRQRLGYPLTTELEKSILKAYRAGTTEPGENTSLNRRHFFIKLQGRRVEIVYDKLRKVIVTVLLPEYNNGTTVPTQCPDKQGQKAS